MAKLLLGSVVGPQGPQGTPGVNGSQGPQGVPGPNEIAATTEVVGLTTGQLLYNNGGKVGNVEIVDNLLSVNPNKPLSANQGKVLKGLIDGNSSAIGQIANDRGYITAKRITLAEMETTFLSGKYFIAGGMGYLDITSHDTAPSDYCLQTHYSLAGDLVRCRTRYAGTWTAWKEIATTEVAILTPLNGWSNYGGAYETLKAIKSGKIVNIVGILNKGSATVSTTIAQLPSGFIPSKQYYAFVNSSSTRQAIEISNDGRIWCSNVTATVETVSFDISFSI